MKQSYKCTKIMRKGVAFQLEGGRQVEENGKKAESQCY